ncbi:MAG TPA: hypothetical protein VII13_06970 [Vicinamibacteria bacterium]|jgi:tetratricopeptide (TPR) repeat protein
MRRAWPLLLCLAAGTPSAAQDHSLCGAVGWVPRDLLSRPLPLRPDVGVAPDPVTTASPEARAFYEQGVAYLHSYVWIEAGRSFHQALRLDPKLALAHVGLSRVYSGLEDPPAARAALAQAEALTGEISPRERWRVSVRRLQLDAIEAPTDSARHHAYKQALDRALREHFEDAELWLLRGNAEEPNAAGRGQRGGAGSVAFYRQALAVSPDHFAAHHYLVHSYENLGAIEKALEHGASYARLASAVPHARHMYGHDLRRVGRVPEAIAEFRRAYELEKAYYAAEKMDASFDWHHPHNLDLLATCHQHQGQSRTAEGYLRESVALDAVVEGIEVNKKAWPLFLLSAGRLEDALGAARAMTAGRWAPARTVGHALSGTALAGLGRLDEAEKELAAAEKEREKLPVELLPGRISRGYVEADVDLLRGELKLRRGRHAEARPLLLDVQRRLRAVPGPDAWIAALFRLEWIFRAARAAGDHELAAATAEQMRDHDAAYGGTQFALGLVAERAGDRAAAAQAFGAALERWHGADPDLPERAEARRRLDALGVAAAAR